MVPVPGSCSVVGRSVSPGDGAMASWGSFMDAKQRCAAAWGQFEAEGRRVEGERDEGATEEAKAVDHARIVYR